MKTKMPVFLILPMMLTLSGCGLYGGKGDGSSVRQTAETGQIIQETIQVGTEKSEISSVSINNFTFIPAELKVRKGATVVWTNNDSAPHQIGSNSFNSGRFGKGQAFSYTFSESGTFEYNCPIHPSMKGRIIVE